MGVVTTLQLVRLAVLARLLSPTDFGLMGMILVVLGFARAFADMGISKAIIYRQDSTRSELSSLYWLNIFAGLVVFAVVCALNPVIISFYKEPRLRGLIYVAALTFLIAPIGQQFQFLMQKELRFNNLARIEIAGAFANTSIAILLAFVGVGVLSIIFGQLTGALVRVFLLLLIGLREWRPQILFLKRGLKRYINFGLYQMGTRTINYVNSEVDHLLVGRMLGAEPLGYYNLAFNLAIRPYFIINPVITRVAFPLFSKVQNDTERLKRGYLKVIQLLSMVNFPIMIGLAAVASIAIPVIFGNQWLPSIVLVQLLSIVGMLRSIANPADSLLLAKGRADLVFKWNLAILVPTLAGLYTGARYGGIVGVATASAILSVVYRIIEYFVLIRPMIGPCLKEYLASMWPSFWMSMAMGSMIFGIGAVLNDINPLLVLIIQLLGGVSVYLVLILYLRRDLFLELKEMLLKKSMI